MSGVPLHVCRASVPNGRRACRPRDGSAASFFHPATSRPAFSLVEVMVSVLIVGGLFVAALNTLGASQVGQMKVGDRARGQMLAQGLMAEILQQSYAESAGALSFGPESGETASGTRSAFDDVDDYHRWTASPPVSRDGTAIAGFAGWTRSVEVAWVGAAAGQPLTASATETGVKRITVTVRRGAVPVAELVALRTRAWPSLEEQQGVVAP